jgi:hypothetical protein
MTAQIEQHPSLTAKVPKGWREEFYVSLDKPFKRAVDQDGCRWYWEGEWILHVPGFRNTPANKGKCDDIACVDHVSGRDAEYPISEAGVISIGKRRIPQRKWHH